MNRATQKSYQVALPYWSGIFPFRHRNLTEVPLTMIRGPVLRIHRGGAVVLYATRLEVFL